MLKMLLPADIIRGMIRPSALCQTTCLRVNKDLLSSQGNAPLEEAVSTVLSAVS